MKHVNDFFRAAVLLRNCNTDKWLALSSLQRSKLVNAFIEQRNRLLDEAYVLATTQYQKPTTADTASDISDTAGDIDIDIDEIVDNIESRAL